MTQPQQRQTVVRVARSSPAFPVAAAAAAAGVSEGEALLAMGDRRTRGQCAALAAAMNTAASRRLRSAVLGSGRVPPYMLRLLRGDYATEISRASLGTAAWDIRDRNRVMGWLTHRRVVVSEAVHGSEFERNKLAELAACPPAVLWRLAADPDWWVRAGVAANRSAGTGMLALLASEEDSSPVTMALLTTKDDCSVAAEEADNNAAALVLVTVAVHGDFDAVEDLERHRNFGPEVVAAMSRNRSEEVRALAAGHELCPTATLAALAQDPENSVRAAVASRTGYP